MMFWPSTLPQAFLSGDAGQSKPTELPQSNIIQTKNDQGQPKYRAAFTAINVEFQGDLIMTKEQVQTFMDFYLAVGAMPWSWLHPRTQNIATFQFTSQAPQSQHLSGGVWVVKVSIMMLAQSGS